MNTLVEKITEVAMEKQLNGNIIGAILDFDNAINLDSNDYQLYIYRGSAKCSIKEFHEAIIDYNKAIELDKNDIVAYKYRAFAFGELKEFDNSIHDISKAIELVEVGDYNANYKSHLYAERAYYKSDKKDFNGSINDFRKVLELKPYDSVAYIEIGKSCIHLKEYNIALDNFNTAICMKPNLSGPYYSRGLAKFLLNDTVGASIDWLRADSFDDGGSFNLFLKPFLSTNEAAVKFYNQLVSLK